MKQPKRGIPGGRMVWPAFFLLLALILSAPSVWIFGMVLPGIAGIAVCRVIILHLLRKTHSLSSDVCKAKGVWDCDKILESPVAKVFGDIGWGDIGLIYFSAQCLFLLLVALSGGLTAAMVLLAIPCTMAFAASFLSLWYQWRIVRSWCKLCLIVTAMVWVQASVLTVYFMQGPPAVFREVLSLPYHPSLWKPVLLLWGISLAIACFWVVIKPLAGRAMEVEGSRRQVLTWKRSPNLFSALLKKTNPIDDEIWEKDLVLGDPAAKIQLTVAMSLYCPACKREYGHLVGLLEKYPADIKAVIRFRHPQRRKTDALFYILDRYFLATSARDRQRILSVWFETMDLAKCKQRLGDTAVKNEYAGLLQQYDTWFLHHEIVYTPTVFFNGHLLPEPFRLPDLNILVGKWMRSPLRFA